MNTLTRKGYGRIYVDEDAHIETVKAIIGQMDYLELEYLPADLIAPYVEYPKVVHTHKFCDLDMDELTARCWRAGVKIWVFDAGHTEWPPQLKDFWPSQRPDSLEVSAPEAAALETTELDVARVRAVLAALLLPESQKKGHHPYAYALRAQVVAFNDKVREAAVALGLRLDHNSDSPISPVK